MALVPLTCVSQDYCGVIARFITYFFSLPTSTRFFISISLSDISYNALIKLAIGEEEKEARKANYFFGTAEQVKGYDIGTYG